MSRLDLYLNKCRHAGAPVQVARNMWSMNEAGVPVSVADSSSSQVGRAESIPIGQHDHWFHKWPSCESRCWPDTRAPRLNNLRNRRNGSGVSVEFLSQ